ncbi:hypothetical protein [Acidocella sp.]|uniref:hypothetical protein n=1 Tax=Acidocella sp. TaxID=50710 RepID=UPI0026137198|nr:hypothetical protein [Acidocella sp.]
MYENERYAITPPAARQTNATRRGLLALTPLAAMAAAKPGATLGQVQHDRELIAACGEIIALEHYMWKALTARYSENQDDELDAAQAPFAARQNHLIKQICAAKAYTMDGCRAKARALAAWAPDLVADDADLGKREFLNDRMVASILRDLVAGDLS